MRLRPGEGLTALPASVLAEVARLAEASPQREVCGFVLRSAGGALAVVEIPNAAPPARAAAAFELEPAAQLRVLSRAAREGGAVVALFHSHLDAPAAPSAEDVAGAFCDGLPLWPGVEHLIVSLRGGRAAEVRRYRAEGGALRPAASGYAPPGPAGPPDSR